MLDNDGSFNIIERAPPLPPKLGDMKTYWLIGRTSGEKSEIINGSNVSETPV